MKNYRLLHCFFIFYCLIAKSKEKPCPDILQVKIEIFSKYDADNFLGW